MRTAYFDCYNGISGDMVLGAFIDLGVPLEELRATLAQLPIGNFSISSQKVQRCGIYATQVTVDTQESRHHRGFSEIREIIEKAELPPRVKDQAIACFRRLAEAEATVHQTTVDEVHFHEVGAVDAIVDIVGSMWAAHYLGIERAVASVVVVGSGTVKSVHGELPVPAPATALLLQGVPVSTGGRIGEHTTPTGAAILRILASEFGTSSPFVYEKVGYGAGSREEKGRTNFLRVFLGTEHSLSLPLEKQKLTIIQTEIDDMTGELFGYVHEKLLQAGALDVCFVPIHMKKNRPAVSIQVLCHGHDAGRLVEFLLRETSTFGVKVLECDRFCLSRSFATISTEWGAVRAKIGYWGDTVLKSVPEYEDCKKIAEQSHLPLRTVFEKVIAKLEELRATGSLGDEKLVPGTTDDK